MQLKMVVVRHVKFPKPLVLVTNNLKLRPPQVYRLYRKRFQLETQRHRPRLIAAVGKAIETQILPPTLTLVYDILPGEKSRLNVGVGLSAVDFHGERSSVPGSE